MNDLRDVSPVQPNELKQGVGVLQARRNKMRFLTILTSVVAIVSLVAIFFNQSLVYSYFDLGLNLKQLHIPVSAQNLYGAMGQNTDYFSHLLQWILWFIFKIVAAFVGATIFVMIAKKINFFKRRMHNFGKRFLAWIIAFSLIIMGVSFAQNEINDHDDYDKQTTRLVGYKTNIQESEMYQLVKYYRLAEPVEDYLLAQTALLNDPADLSAATAYIKKLENAEKNDANFASYGFKAEQIWTMQKQINSKQITAFAKEAENKQNLADKIVQYTQWVWMAMFVIFSIFAFIVFGLARQFDKRISRIENRLN